MGIRYTIELLTDAGRVDELLAALAEHLCSRDAERIRAALPWVPAIDRMLVWGTGRPVPDMQGVHGLAMGTEQPNDVCLSLELAPDAQLEAHWREMLRYVPVPDRIPVGCLWTHLDVGEQHALLRCTAATSGISRLFVDSPSVRTAWRAIGQQASVSALLLDLEGLPDKHLLWPEERLVPGLGLDGFCSEGFDAIRVDHYVYEQLRLARLLGDG